MNKKRIILFSLLIIVVLTSYLTYVTFTVPQVNLSQKCLKAAKSKNELCAKNPNFVEFDELSQNLIDAVLVAEDISFFHHGGFDFYEIKESFLTNLKRFRFARGGSTITQQMIKNVYLSPEKTLRRKFHEAILTSRVEDKLSKERILEMYFNAIEFGPDIYGIKAAADYYFDKHPKNINILEAAFLAFLLPSPKVYNSSYEDGELTEFAKRRLKDIIKKMHFYKKITVEQHDLALQLMPEFPWLSLTYEEQMELSEQDGEES